VKGFGPASSICKELETKAQFPSVWQYQKLQSAAQNEFQPNSKHSIYNEFMNFCQASSQAFSYIEPSDLRAPKKLHREKETKHRIRLLTSAD